MKFLNILSGFLFLTFSLSCIAQSTKDYDLENFNSIDVEGAIYVEVSQGDPYKVRLECEESLMKHIDIQVSNEDLKISIKGKYSSKEQVKVYITMPNLTELEVSGASKVKLAGMTLDILKVDISGASELQGDLNIEDISVDASGASSIGISGRTNKMNLYLSGASNFKGKGFLISGELLADFSGASSAQCQIDGDMFLKMTGASSFVYHGQGTILKQETSGASSILKE